MVIQYNDSRISHSMLHNFVFKGPQKMSHATEHEVTSPFSVA
jgi:hypothetical protein